MLIKQFLLQHNIISKDWKGRPISMKMLQLGMLSKLVFMSMKIV